MKKTKSFKENRPENYHVHDNGWVGMIVSDESMDLTDWSVTYSNSDSDVSKITGLAVVPIDGDGALDLKEKFLSDSLH